MHSAIKRNKKQVRWSWKKTRHLRGYHQKASWKSTMKPSFPSFKVEDDEPLCPVCDGLIEQHSEEQVIQCYNLLCKGCKEDATRTWDVSCNNFAKLLWDLNKKVWRDYALRISCKYD